MKKQTIKIAMRRGEVQEVQAELFTSTFVPNRQLAIHKNTKGYWVITDVHTGMDITQHVSEKTKKATLEGFTNMLARLEGNMLDNFNSAIQSKDDVQTHANNYNRDLQLFASIAERTKLNIQLDTIAHTWQDKVRINVIHLDRLINTPDGTSTRQHIENLYGTEILTDILKLI